MIEGSSIAPLAHAGVCKQVINRRTVSEAMLAHQWTNDVSGELSVDRMLQIINLWEIMINMVLDPMQRDSPIWRWNNTGCYTSKSTHDMLWHGSISFSQRAQSGNVGRHFRAKYSRGLLRSTGSGHRIEDYDMAYKIKSLLATFAHGRRTRLTTS